MNKILLFLLILIISGCSGIKNKKSETYTPGFRIIKTVDKPRIYKSGNCVSNNCFNTTLKLILPFFDEHLKNEKSFSMAVNAEIDKTIKEISK